MTFHHRNESVKMAIFKRILVYGILLFLLATIESSFFSNLSFLSTVPHIVMGAVVAISLLDSQKNAVVSAIAAGFLVDAIGSSGLSLTPIFFLIISLLSSELAKKILPNFLSYIVILIPAAVISALFTSLNIYFLTGSFLFKSIFKTILLPEFITTILFSIPIFFITKLSLKIVNAKGKFKI